MTPERWRQVTRIYEAALDREPAARDTFLTLECGGDDELRRQIESLLAHDGTPIIVDRPIEETAAAVLEETPRLKPGTTIASYRVDALVGVGGMGEVYRARDLKLNRDVALKVLPETFMRDGDRVARFLREAHVLASLNHPHIAAIHGLEDSGAVHALVLELVEGPTLANRIERAALPMDEALPIARQIADAVAAAHDHGIIHRDLKPANIKIRDDGTVKVLDFGLARETTNDAPRADGAASARGISRSPTVLSPAMTAMGVILGTAAYMSPEQAKGRQADRRSDVWAFGCVLYEMLSGRRAFEGDDVSDTMASVLKGQPDWSMLPADTPSAIRRLLRRALEKDPRRRLHDIADARLELDDAIANVGDGARPESSGVGDATSPSAWRRVLPWTVAAALAAAFVISLVGWAPWRPTAAAPLPQRLTIELGVDEALGAGGGGGPQLAISRDGSMLAFVGGLARESRLYLRRLDELQAVSLATGVTSPFFSPDGRWIGFFSYPDRKLKKISVDGGTAIAICDWLTLPSRGASWGDDGYIVFNPSAVRGNLLRVSADGGSPEPASALTGSEATHRWPQVLPGSKAILFTSLDTNSGTDNTRIVVQTLPSGPSRTIIRDGYHARYVASGHLLYMQGATLMAVPFDVDRLEVLGSPVSIVDGVLSTTEATASWFDVSDTGALVYRPGGQIGNDLPLLWMRRDGTTTPMRNVPIDWRNAQFSPDGQRLAFGVEQRGQTDLWVYDWPRDTMTRLTTDPGDDTSPVWAPDGRSVVFASTRGDKKTLNLYWQRADGAGEARRLTDGAAEQRPHSWHPSGKYLAFTEWTQQAARATSGSAMILPMEEGESGWQAGAPVPFVREPGIAAVNGMFSPDGRWLAYQSAEAGAGSSEVFVRPFPSGSGRWQISTAGGMVPTWSRRRNELVYFSMVDLHLMGVTYTVEGNTFRADAPQRWSEQPILMRPGQRWFDLHPDGDRVVVGGTTTSQTSAGFDKVVLVTNLLDELRRRAPRAR